MALVERKLGRTYDAAERPLQLAAARAIIARHPPLDLALFERVYDAGNDAWWKQHYGELHLTHLAALEKHGTMRFSRLLARHTASAPQAAPRLSRGTITPTPEQLAGLRPIIGVSGRPRFIPSATPLRVLPPERPAPRPGLASALGGV